MTRFELTNVRPKAEGLKRYFEIVTALGYQGEAVERDHPLPEYRTWYYVEVPTFDDLARIIEALEAVADADYRVIITMAPGCTPELEIYDYPDD